MMSFYVNYEYEGIWKNVYQISSLYNKQDTKLNETK